MCLGEIVQVVALRPGLAASVRSERGQAEISLLPLDGPVAEGDWLLVHSGFALGRLDAAQAEAALAARNPATVGQETPR